MFPGLAYQDAAAAVDWLERAFGFERLIVIPGDDGKVVHAELKLGAGVVMIGTARDRDGGAVRGVFPFNDGPCVYVADPDEHCRVAQAAGAEVVIPLADTSYGARAYSVADLEGRVWTFGMYRPG
ncbi:hypothetical protein AYO38_09380 [bacterium SCGC AG-212-C10]|nr:hypothetical protein AYO38_09380 [bacterium SCGC AG-212-C10]